MAISNWLDYWFKRIYYIVILLLIVFPECKGLETSLPDTTRDAEIEQLRLNYAVNKIMPSDLERNILITLSYYPELRNTKITFCYRKIFTSMKAVPTWNFFLHSARNRSYRIVINKKQCHGKNITQRITPSAFKGVIGHELGHIVDYSRRSNRGLFKLFYSYLFIEGRKITENTADVIAIDHGLGQEMIEFDELLFQDNCAKPSYLDYKKKYYNTPDHLRILIKQKQSSANTSR